MNKNLISQIKILSKYRFLKSGFNQQHMTYILTNKN